MAYETLTNDDKKLIYQVILDLETGHHLLSERPKEFWDMLLEYGNAKNSDNKTKRQREIMEYASNFFYYDDEDDD